MGSIALQTLAVLRELTSGDVVVGLAADPKLAAYGEEDEALLEAQMFLSEYLAKADPEVVARFSLPPGTRLHKTPVVIPRDDLPRRWNVATPIELASLVIPTVPNTRGLRDSWVMVLPLLHTFFSPASEAEDLDEAIASEVKRIVAARELTPLEYLDLLPAPRERLAEVTVTFTRDGSAELAQGTNLRKRIAEHEAKKEALRVLESIGDPLHAGLTNVDPRPFPGREKELGLLRAILARDARLSTLLVGPERSGKSGLFRAWLEREFEVNRPRFVFATSGARLVAGMSGFGQWQERVRRVMEAAARIDAVLYFDDLADLFADRPGGHLDLPSAMRPFLDEGKVRLVAEIREDLLERLEPRNGGFFAAFGRVRIAPFDARTTIRVLEELAADDRRRNRDRPVLGPPAIAALVELAERYLPYESFPGKAVRLATEIRGAYEIERGSEAAGATIDPDTVHQAFSVRTGVPTFLLRDDQSLRVDDVFATLRRRLVGQDHAVRRVAELVGVIKAGLQPRGKPLATLLFVGPTGVGKTELARALATLLFGGEDRLARFDMSEYASAGATERLFRGIDGGEGLLTRKVREQPFSVILLDEIEKAHPAAFDLLLQVCGEGRLTDGRGKTAYFHNAIVILTSNLGAAHRRPEAGFAPAAREQGDDERAAAHYAKVVRETFRPEFVNRIDRIVAFRALSAGDIREVARITTARAASRRGIVERRIDLRVAEDAVARLAEGGRSEAYGARALRRHVERELVTPMARLISARGGGTGDGAVDGQRIVVSASGESGGIAVDVERVPSRRTGNAAHDLDAITAIRRRMHRQLVLDRIAQLEDHVDYLVAQLGHGERARKRRRDAPAGQELGWMTAEHSYLGELRERLHKSWGELVAVEELALVGFMAGEPLRQLHDDARAFDVKFRLDLVHALVAQEPRRNEAVVLVSELDDRRGFDFWLAPLLDDAERRRWTITGHIDADRAPPPANAPPWPAHRRWGPPREVADLRQRISDRDRTFRNVVLSVAGDHAGVWLALEGGIHRFTGFRSGDPVHLQVVLVARRANLVEGEWDPPVLDPPLPLATPALSKGPAVRAHDAARHTIGIAAGSGSVSLELPHRDYWPRFEEVALEHLLAFERDRSLDRDAALRPILDDTMAEVRNLARADRKIDAIRLYRQLTGAGLAESKQAVEAMTRR